MSKGYPGWRTMTGAQRRNAKYDRLWEDAKRRDPQLFLGSDEARAIAQQEAEMSDDLKAINTANAIRGAG